MFFRKNSQSGMSIVIVVILLAMLGFYATSLSMAFKTEFTLQEKLDRKVVSLAIFQYAQRTMDCDAARSNYPTCPASGFLRLPSKVSGLPLTVQMFDPTNPTSATKIGEYYVRASCYNPVTKDKKTIYLEASPTKLKTPLWQPINPNFALGCSLP